MECPACKAVLLKSLLVKVISEKIIVQCPNCDLIISLGITTDGQVRIRDSEAEDE